MICPNCGNHAGEGTETCPVCGSRLVDSPLFQETQMLQIEETQMFKIDDIREQPQKKAFPFKTVFMIAGILLLILILILLNR